MRKNLEKPLTEVELEIMQLIWNLEGCTIREVFDSLPENRELAYTSVATMVKILETKGAIVLDKKERAVMIKPKISREEYEVASLKHLSNSVFRGNATSMVTRLLDTTDLSSEELGALKKLINELARR